MKDKKQQSGCTCGCCSGNAQDVLLSGNVGAADVVEPTKMSRATFLKAMAMGAVGLTTLSGPVSAAQASENQRIVPGTNNDSMIVDMAVRELRISATVTKDVTKPSVADWGRRFQAFFGAAGGKMEPFFIFTTGVSRVEINKAVLEMGIRHRRQIPFNEVEQRRGLKATTTKDDYLDGDPVIVTVRFMKDGQMVEAALEDFIQEKIMVGEAEVIKPYTPHFVYHGTGEALNFPSGCIVCPSDCNGGIITDNVLPLKTTENYYKVDWDKMPPVGSKVEVVIKSIYGPQPLSSVKA